MMPRSFAHSPYITFFLITAILMFCPALYQGFLGVRSDSMTKQFNTVWKVFNSWFSSVTLVTQICHLLIEGNTHWTNWYAPLILLVKPAVHFKNCFQYSGSCSDFFYSGKIILCSLFNLRNSAYFLLFFSSSFNTRCVIHTFLFIIKMYTPLKINSIMEC